MHTRSDFPRKVREIENLWVPMPDGTRLAARVWLPEDAEADPVPVVLEYIPYRKRDRQAIQDRTIHCYFAGHGYAAVRLDIRGTGDSEGLIEDEYTRREHDDAVAAIAWFAEQPWCSGSVGMMGISWGGFNSLQVAARRPPAVKAIVTVCSTDDRYADDVHYMGGCVLTATAGWGTTFLGYTPVPPDPAVVGERWREMWFDRMRSCPLATGNWLSHQTRDDYWRHGSVCEDYAAIEAAVYAVGGWADGYTNTVMRLLEHLPGPRKGLIGPWGHAYPHNAGPGPAIGFLQEALRWWDHWLKGIDTGIMDEPMLRTWMQESEPPRAQYEDRAGRWVAEPVWPPRATETLALAPNEDRLDAEPREEVAIAFSSPLGVGSASGDWDPYGLGPDMAADQRDDDDASLVFDSEPLDAPLEILGTPWLTLDIAADKPNAQIAARVCDVSPDSTSVRVTYVLFNLTHRGGHATVRPLEPGRRYRVRVKLNDCGYAFPAGHRIRLALSTSYWSVAWPSPETPTLTVFTSNGSLELPVRRARPEDDALAEFAPPETAEPPPHRRIHPAKRGRVSSTTDDAGGEIRTVFQRSRGEFRLTDIDWNHGGWGEDVHSIRLGDPRSARTEYRRVVTFARDELRVRVESSMTLTSTADAFRLQAGFQAYEGDARVYARDWDLSVPREGV